MSRLQQRAETVILDDPDVESTASFIGGGGAGGASVNQGRIFIALKPEGVRSGSSQTVIARLRRKLAQVAGMTVYMFPVQDLRGGGRQSKSQYQFALWDPSLTELDEWTPKVVAELRKLPELADVTTDRERGGLKAALVIDRERRGTARRRHLRHRHRAQRRVWAAAGLHHPHAAQSVPRRRRDADGAPARSHRLLGALRARRQWHAGAADGRRPRGSAARWRWSSITRARFPQPRVSFNLAPGGTLDGATTAIERAVAGMNVPDNLRTEFRGRCARKPAVDNAGGRRGWLIVIGAASAVYHHPRRAL